MSKIKRIIEIEDNYEGMLLKEALHDLNDCVLPVVGGKSVAFAVEILRALENGKPYDDSGDLISREALRETVNAFYDSHFKGLVPTELITYAKAVDDFIDNAPPVEPLERIGSICEENCGYRPQGKYVDISKLRLMTVEECAGHTIDYAMGWKACIEWIKKGGAE